MIKSSRIYALLILFLIASNFVTLFAMYDRQKNHGINVGVMDGVTALNFSDSGSYIKLISRAENGDIDAINELIGYYFNGGPSDMRNLKYWSDKLYDYQKEGAYHNYVTALVDNNLCLEAWQYLEKSFSDRTTFSLYEARGGDELIDKKCRRKIS